MQKKEVKILPWQKLYKVGFFNIRQYFIEHKYYFIVRCKMKLNIFK